MDLLAAMTTFVRVVDAGSLSKAARAARVSPAAVSRQLTTLEAELGAPLLVRTTRRIAVTEEGLRFYARATRTMSEAEEARACVRPESGISGQLTVSVPTALGLSRLDSSIAALVKKHPGLRIDLRIEDHPVDLVAEAVDVAIRAGLPPPDSTTVVAQPIARSERLLVAAPSYLRRRGEPRHPSELLRHDALVHLHTGARVGTWTLHAGGQSLSLEVRGVFRSNALHALANAAVAGAGVALLPRFLVAAAVAHRRLRALHLGGWQPEGQQIYALVRAESKGRARVRVFLEHARAQLGEA